MSQMHCSFALKNIYKSFFYQLSHDVTNSSFLHGFHCLAVSECQINISISLFPRSAPSSAELDKTFPARRLNCFPRDYLNDSSLFALTAALQILLPLRFPQNHLSPPSALMQFSLHPLIPPFCLSLRRPLLNFMISLFFALSADSSRLFSLHCTPCSFHNSLSLRFLLSNFSPLTRFSPYSYLL